MARQGLSRRQMLKGTALVLGSLSGSAILAACGGSQPPPKPAESSKPAAEAAKPAAPAAAPAKPAEAPKPAAPAAAPAATSAPAAAAKPAAGTAVVTVRDHDWIQGTPGQPND